MAELEERGSPAGAPAVQLDTNRTLTEAIALYRKTGYVEVEPFNDEPYAHHWFRKDLSGMADCLFCSIVAGDTPAHTVLDDDVVVAFLDVRPLFPGHVLVVPREHHVTLPDLPADLVGPVLRAGAADRRRGAARDGRQGVVRGDEQRRQPERAAPARARGAAHEGRRPPRVLLAAHQVPRRRRTPPRSRPSIRAALGSG